MTVRSLPALISCAHMPSTERCGHKLAGPFKKLKSSSPGKEQEAAASWDMVAEAIGHVSHFQACHPPPPTPAAENCSAHYTQEMQ